MIAKGFGPKETGGWRINLNRPSENTSLSGRSELSTEKATEVYHAFRGLVLEAAEGNLDLYVDIHQYGVESTIQVAAVGFSAEEARVIKGLYRAIRDLNLRYKPHLRRVDLLIEPIDSVPIGARDAKSEGILG